MGDFDRICQLFGATSFLANIPSERTRGNGVYPLGLGRILGDSLVRIPVTSWPGKTRCNARVLRMLVAGARRMSSENPRDCYRTWVSKIRASL